jgi:NADH-quinone oxidoreductase subunit N
MNETLIEFLGGYTATNNWGAILPEILLALLALGLLAAEVILPKGKHAMIGRLSIIGQVGILAMLLLPNACSEWIGTTNFSGMIALTDVGQLMRGFFLVCSILVTYLGGVYLSKQKLPKTEFFHLVLVIAAASMLLVQSVNFVMLFVALEAVTVAFYVLVAYCRTSSLSLEAGLKYLILGALSSSILLFGIVLLYGVAGNPELVGASRDSLNFTALGNFISFNAENPLVLGGALMVISGICFKIGAVPFQIWVPDVYQGAPTPVTAYLAIGSKAAGFMVLLNLVTGPFADIAYFLKPVLTVVAVVTILFGNIAAVSQKNVKRMMGLSGIAHAGYLLVGVIAAMTVDWAVYAVIFYLVTYLLASFAVFAVMAHLSGADDADQALSHYTNLARKHPFLGGVLAVGLGSLAGIPPLGGFIGKLFLFVAAYEAGLYGLLGVSIIGVVISIYYYFGWIRECYFADSVVEPSESMLSGKDRWVMGVLVAATVVIGLYPSVLPIIP